MFLKNNIFIKAEKQQRLRNTVNKKHRGQIASSEKKSRLKTIKQKALIQTGIFWNSFSFSKDQFTQKNISCIFLCTTSTNTTFSAGVSSHAWLYFKQEIIPVKLEKDMKWEMKNKKDIKKS